MHINIGKWVPVNTAWHFLKLLKEEQPSDMKVGCEHFEQAVVGFPNRLLSYI
jgi:hypothetical protein